MRAPTIDIDDIRARSKHPRVAGSGDDVGNWSDDIVEVLRDAVAGILRSYAEGWNWTATGAVTAYKSAFYLLFDNVAFKSERGGAFDSENMGSYSYSLKDGLPDDVKEIIRSYSANSDGFSAGRFYRTGRSRR